MGTIKVSENVVYETDSYIIIMLHRFTCSNVCYVKDKLRGREITIYFSDITELKDSLNLWGLWEVEDEILSNIIT